MEGSVTILYGAGAAVATPAGAQKALPIDSGELAHGSSPTPPLFRLLSNSDLWLAFLQGASLLEPPVASHAHKAAVRTWIENYGSLFDLDLIRSFGLSGCSSDSYLTETAKGD
jgi:hypothetical protein